MSSIQPIRLGVNVDHVATLRQQRDERYPDPIHAAAIAEQAGAEQITIHLREDRRHITDRDLEVLSRTCQTRLNLEMAVTEEMIGLALRHRPGTVTLVPEKREERTTEGGLDVIGGGEALCNGVQKLQDAGIEVSLFVDPDEHQLDASRKTGATIVELHTGDYAEARGEAVHAELKRLDAGARYADSLGLIVAAGHGLHYHNTAPIAAIAPIVELNIGHALIARAVFSGMHGAVQEMVELMRRARHGAC